MVWFSQVFDVTLLATIGLIFMVTMVGAYLRSRQVDRCLKSFEEFHVTLERTDGHRIWGVMELESTGLELRYRGSIQDTNHIESSYVYYASEYETIQAIYRFVDHMTADERKRRALDIRRSFHPGPLRRVRRSLRHFVATANESLAEVIGVIAGRLKQPAGRYIDDTGAEQLTTLGKSVIGSVGHLHDPLLERYIGQKVVVELLEGDEIHEHVGIFKDYSADFIELLDVQTPHQESLCLGAHENNQTEAVQITREQDLLRVVNGGDYLILLHSLQLAEAEELLNVVVDVGETVEVQIDERFQQAELHLRIIRELDMIVPRTRCLVRHRAEQYQPELLPDIIFDIGIVLRGNSLHAAREERLRRQLTANPTMALAAANLGALLMQNREFSEAEDWLQRACALRHSLPDNGRRAQMLLRELRRRRDKGIRAYRLPTNSENLAGYHVATNGKRPDPFDGQAPR